MARTGVDSLAISIGTSHGAYKFKPGQNPEIRLDILRQIEKRIPGFPIVLHDPSVPPEAVERSTGTAAACRIPSGFPRRSFGGGTVGRLQDQHRPDGRSS